MASSEQSSCLNKEEDSCEVLAESHPEKFECAVCLQTCIQPVLLPCGHIFCYLCVKGVTHQSKRCAMCRQEIPANYLDNPHVIAADMPTVTFEGSYQWFYEGRNGWWQYDDRTSTEIEASFKRGEDFCEVLIAGFLYEIDFDKHVQARRSDPSRRRRIKRDLISIPKKGVAGIRIPSDTTSSPESLCVGGSQAENSSSCCSQKSDSQNSEESESEIKVED